MREVMNAQQASRVVGCSGLEMRHNIRFGVWNFGRMLSKKSHGGKYDKFIINTREMCKYFDIPFSKIEQMESEGAFSRIARKS